MILWLLGHVWWLVPAAIGLVALGAFLGGFWPIVAAGIAARIPPRALALACAVLAAIVAGSGMYALGKAHGVDSCRAKLEAAEARADTKAAKVAARAHDKADAESAALSKITEDAANEVRTIVRSIPRACPDPVLPERVHDRIGDAVRRAREALPDSPSRDP